MKPMAAVAAFIVLFAPGARAQDVTRPASSHRAEHSRRSTSPSTEPRGPFDAGPGTYAPRYTSPQRRHRGYGDGFGYGLPFYDPALDVAPDAEAPQAAPDQANLNVGQPEPSAPARPPQAQTPHAPDTFYVIPGCYAGNRPPQPERLPKGCQVAKLRATPVR